MNQKHHRNNKTVYLLIKNDIAYLHAKSLTNVMPSLIFCPYVRGGI